MKRRLELQLPLSPSDLDAMHARVLRVLDEIGIEVADTAALDRLAGMPGVRRAGNRICLDADSVEGELAALRRRRAAASSPEDVLWGMPERASDDIHLMVSIGGRFSYQNVATDAWEEFTPANCIALVKLADSLYAEGVRYRGQHRVAGVPAALEGLAALRIDLEYSRDAFPCYTAAIFPDDGFDLVLEMYRTVGRPYVHFFWPVEPLKLAGEGFRQALGLIGKAGALLGAHSFALAGVSAPMPPALAFVQTTATALGGYVIMRLLAGDQALGFYIHAYPALPIPTEDVLPGGAPAPLRLWWSLIECQVRGYYGEAPMMRLRGAQRETKTLLGALLGCRAFQYAGLLPAGFSSRQLLWDLDQVRHARLMRDGFDFQAGALASVAESVREGMEEGIFTGQRATVESWRKLYWTPRYRAISEMEGGEATPADDAYLRELIRARIASHEWRLDSAQGRELNRIYGRACERYGEGYRPDGLV